MSDVAGVPGGDMFHSSSTSLPSEECREGGGGEENVNIARKYDQSQFLLDPLKQFEPTPPTDNLHMVVIDDTVFTVYQFR